MKLEISNVANKGELAKERLIMKVLSDTDIGNYAILQSGFFDGSVTINIHHTYWPPYKKVAAGDLVVLYTRAGEQNEKLLDDGSRAHFFYWGLKSCIWTSDDRAPLILYSPTWTSKNPDSI